MLGTRIKSVIAYHNFYCDNSESVSLWPDSDAAVSDRIQIKFPDSMKVWENEFEWGKAYAFDGSMFTGFNECFRAKNGDVYVLFFDQFSGKVRKVHCNYEIE